MAPLWGQAWRFGISGIVGLAADVVLLYLLLFLGSGYFAGRAVSFIASVWVTWQCNRRFAFRAVAGRASWRQWWSYLFAMSGGGIVNYAAYSLAIVYLPGQALKPLYAVAIGSLAGMAINFAAARLIVFRTRDRAQAALSRNPGTDHL